MFRSVFAKLERLGDGWVCSLYDERQGKTPLCSMTGSWSAVTQELESVMSTAVLLEELSRDARRRHDSQIRRRPTEPEH